MATAAAATLVRPLSTNPNRPSVNQNRPVIYYGNVRPVSGSNVIRPVTPNVPALPSFPGLNKPSGFTVTSPSFFGLGSTLTVNPDGTKSISSKTVSSGIPNPITDAIESVATPENLLAVVAVIVALGLVFIGARGMIGV
jgi:hypothetical protein